MFISSMARKNQLKHSKSEGSIRKSTGRIRDKLHEKERKENNKEIIATCSIPPQSPVKKSNVIFVNGSVKQLQRIREKQNLSNSAKTIRPVSSLPPSSHVQIPSNSNSFIKIQSADDEMDNDIINQSTLDELEMSKNLKERLSLRSSLGQSSSEQIQSTKFIDPPKDAEWYLDPLHRRGIYSDRSLSRRSFDVHNEYRTGILDWERVLSDDDDDDDGDVNHNKPFNDESVLGNNYLEVSKNFEKEALERAGCTSPYELELCRLRKEKLRLEESYLLKKKYEYEIERTRAPKPKWYELKTPEFTVEMEKHGNLITNKKYWNEIIDYRNQLHDSVDQLSNS